QGQPGLGGVSFALPELEAAVAEGVLSAQLVDRYCTVLMAGIAAETMVYGEAEGGVDDRQALKSLWAQLKRAPAEAELKQRWATLQAKNLIEAHPKAYKALVAAMERQEPVESCCRAIEQGTNQIERGV
ncbi:MAG TPA: ATP-dependent Zn protease, partial [Allocoleopsis sp.]